MKKTFPAYYALSLIVLLGFSACKNKTTDAPKMDTTVVTPAVPERIPDTAVVINGSDSLRNMLPDAIKDFPGVGATVDGTGVITLTGKIKRENLPKLMMSVNALHPKKVVNNITIQ